MKNALFDSNLAETAKDLERKNQLFKRAMRADIKELESFSIPELEYVLAELDKQIIEEEQKNKELKQILSQYKNESEDE